VNRNQTNAIARFFQDRLRDRGEDGSLRAEIGGEQRSGETDPLPGAQKERRRIDLLVQYYFLRGRGTGVKSRRDWSGPREIESEGTDEERRMG